MVDGLRHRDDERTALLAKAVEIANASARCSR
jgi:hypothetical protein